MILYEDGFLKLDYDASTDILYVPCPNIQDYELLHIQKALTIVVETLISYDIKKFLFDSSKSLIEVTGEEYQYLLAQLARGLMTSRLQKLARVVSADSVRERELENFLTARAAQLSLPYTIQNFNTKAAALDWLIKG